MTLGFSAPERFKSLKKELLTWKLYQVHVDKYYVMFWFENGHCLLNSAYRFGFLSADRSIDYIYDVQAPGGRKFLNVDSILRQSVKDVEALDERRLGLIFENDDLLIIHDDPKSRSAWFYRYNPVDEDGPLLWSEDDELGEDEF